MGLFNKKSINSSNIFTAREFEEELDRKMNIRATHTYSCSLHYKFNDFDLTTYSINESIKNQKCRMYKGILNTNIPGESNIEQMTIYAVQPFLDESKHDFIGPEEDENLSSAEYYFNTSSEGKYGVYIPRVDSLTGLSMEFERASTISIEDRFQTRPEFELKDASRTVKYIFENISKYIWIEYEKDINGNTIFFDLSDPKNKKEYLEYRDRYYKHRGTIGLQIYTLIEKAKEKCEHDKFLEDRKEREIYMEALYQQAEDAKAKSEEKKRLEKELKNDIRTTAEYEKRRKEIDDYNIYGIAPSYASPLYGKNVGTPIPESYIYDDKIYNYYKYGISPSYSSPLKDLE